MQHTRIYTESWETTQRLLFLKLQNTASKRKRNPSASVKTCGFAHPGANSQLGCYDSLHVCLLLVMYATKRKTIFQYSFCQTIEPWGWTEYRLTERKSFSLRQ